MKKIKIASAALAPVLALAVLGTAAAIPTADVPVAATVPQQVQPTPTPTPTPVVAAPVVKAKAKAPAPKAVPVAVVATPTPAAPAPAAPAPVETAAPVVPAPAPTPIVPAWAEGYLPCEQEDSEGPCYWDATKFGNGTGISFLRPGDGTTVYFPNEAVTQCAEYVNGYFDALAEGDTTNIPSPDYDDLVFRCGRALAETDDPDEAQAIVIFDLML